MVLFEDCSNGRDKFERRLKIVNEVIDGREAAANPAKRSGIADELELNVFGCFEDGFDAGLKLLKFDGNIGDFKR